MFLTTEAITPASFIDRNGRRVLADSGQPGMNGREGIYSTTEGTVARFASVLADVSARSLSSAQYDVLRNWIEMGREAAQSYDPDKQITSASFVDHEGFRVLIESGESVMKAGKEDESSTEKILARFASMLAHDSAWMLDKDQYGDLLRWVAMCRTAS